MSGGCLASVPSRDSQFFVFAMGWTRVVERDKRGLLLYIILKAVP